MRNQLIIWTALLSLPLTTAATLVVSTMIRRLLASTVMNVLATAYEVNFKWCQSG